MTTLSGISITELERAVKTAARVVSLYGEIYLPVFERLHEELEKMKRLEEKKILALNLVKGYSDILIVE